MSNNNTTTEQMIQDKNLNALRLNQDLIKLKKKYIGKIVIVTDENIDGTNEYEFLKSILNKEMIIENVTNLYNDLSIPTFKMKFKENNKIVKKKENDNYFPFVESDFKMKDL